MPITLADIKPGTWLIAEADVVGRRRMIVVDQKGNYATVSDTGFIMLEGMTVQQVFNNYKTGWRVQK